MSEWTSGYVSELGYTYGYYSELGTSQIAFLLALQGWHAPKVKTALELGYGQGVSINIHAASNDVEWWGTDFNPSQAAFAMNLSEASQSGATLYDDSFHELLSREDLPVFDFICLHGIWSWISEQNRAVIVDLIRDKLAVGGVVYVSYNTLPGWSGFAPLRHLMTAHANTLSSEGTGLAGRIEGAIGFAEEVLELKPNYLKSFPAATSRVESLKKQSRHYLAHEYFNKDWHPMHFGTMAELMSSAKLQYAGPADFLSTVDAINVSPEQKAFLNKISDTHFRESVRDFMTNMQFRKDYWIKGPRQLNQSEHFRIIREQEIVLVAPLDEIKLKVSGARGELDLQPSIYEPVLQSLANHEPRRIGDIESELCGSDSQGGAIEWPQLVQAITVLLGKGNVRLVMNPGASAVIEKQTAALNEVIMDRARHSAEINTLASPLLGAGAGVSQIDQILIGLLKNAELSVDSLVDQLWGILSAQGARLMEEGRELATEEENLVALRALVQSFEKKRRPILESLQIM